MALVTGCRLIWRLILGSELPAVGFVDGIGDSWLHMGMYKSYI